MNILITGTSGFIASKLAKRLTELNYNVIGLDKNPKGEFTSHVFDISDKDFPKYDFGQIDIIFHLAAQSGGYMSLKDPYIDSLWNSVGTANMITLAKNNQIKKFVFISSMAIYGNAVLVTEKTPPNPISFYGVSKYTGELQTKLLYEHQRINYSIFRLFSTYGSGQDLENKHQGILSIYLKQILEGDIIKITGAKNRTREVIHVNDVIDALLFSLDSRTDNNIYNLTNSQTITPELIINEISKQLNKKVEIIEIDGYEGDQTHITSHRSLLFELGWKPKYNLVDGVKEFINNLK